MDAPKPKTITIITKNVNENPKVVQIPSDVAECLVALQKIVNGYIEAVPFDDCLIIRNVGGWLLDFQPNFLHNGNLIVGNVAFVGLDGECFVSLKNNQINKILHKFSSKHRSKT